MVKKFTVSDGDLTLVLRPAGKGWYAVTSQQDPRITTQARTLEEAFLMARDGRKLLKKADAKVARLRVKGAETTAGTPKPALERPARTKAIPTNP
jgi:hypothetical protein